MLEQFDWHSPSRGSHLFRRNRRRDRGAPFGISGIVEWPFVPFLRVCESAYTLTIRGIPTGVWSEATTLDKVCASAKPATFLRVS
jgi:hypothetical protein